MNTNIGPKIQTLTELGSSAIQATIKEYSNWYFISSIVWIGFGIVLAVVAILLWKNRNKLTDRDLAPVAYIGSPVLLFCALLTLPVNVPTLLNPTAYATHQLIEDIRGNK